MHTTDYSNGMDDGYRKGLQEGRRQASDRVKELQEQLAQQQLLLEALKQSNDRLRKAYERMKIETHAFRYGGGFRAGELHVICAGEKEGYSRYTVDEHGVVSGVIATVRPYERRYGR